MNARTSSDSPVAQRSENGDKDQPARKGAKFWLIFVSMCICDFLSGLEFASVSTALPTIANALHTTQFTWAGSAYALSSAAFLPMSGGLAQIFGRRPAILMTIGLFALGSGICGGANSMNMFIAGRVIQGLGGGGIQSLTGVIIADLLPLQERAVYSGLYTLVWVLAASIGSVVGGGLAAYGQWRWLFYLNLPITFISGVLVMFFLDLPIPPGSYRDKLMRMDWIGNCLVISSTAIYMIALTWGGITAPWSSPMVLVPLVCGLIGLVAFIAYEATLAKFPLVPLSLMTNMTSISGYIQAFCSFVVGSALLYYVPVYFQACKSASPVLSGTYFLAFASVGPVAVITGVSIKITGRYRPQIWLGWAITVIAFGLMSIVRTTDAVGLSVGYIGLLGCGFGILNTATMYPILAALPVTQNAPAVTLIWFLRLLAAAWGITVGSTVFQNELAKKLPLSFIQSVPQGTAILFALIPQISAYPPEMRYEVQVAIASSLAVLWRVSAAISGAGFVASLFMRGLPLKNVLDPEWSLTDREADRRA